MNKPTIFDVAARAHVSNATVSRALNEPDLVKPDTRMKIIKAANELGYKPNALARGLASSKSTQVGLVVSDLARASVAEMVKGIIAVAYTYKYNLTIFESKVDDDPHELLTDLISSRVDGVLYLVDEITDLRYQMIKELNKTYQIPLVLVNTIYPKDSSINSVTIDYDEAGYEVTRKLIDEGRANIALLTTLKRYPVSILKENGYLRAIKEANLEPMICYTCGNLDKNIKDFTAFFSNNKVDGVIGVRDSITISAMNYLQDKGFKVPNDISFYGFQNTRYGLMSRPTLSTIDIPTNELGAKAMKILTSLMVGESVESKAIYLKHSIIERQSTKGE